MTKKISILALLAVFLLTSGLGCKTQDRAATEATKPITLTYWRVFEGRDAFEQIIQNYNALHPFVRIEYRKLRYDEYERELLNALAEDRGPDIFSIHNTWIKKYQSKIEPMPESTTMAYSVVKGTVKKEVVPELRTMRSPSLREIRDNFVEVVGRDVILEDGKVYGLPLSVDTLAMFYNKDLLNNAGVSEIPKYWSRDFLQVVKKLTKQDPKRGMIQAGIAMGSSSNIDRFSDILTLLMMQNGATMINDQGRVSFQLLPPGGQSDYNPGLEAVRFYTDFANPAKEAYAWSEELPNSLEMFTSGNLAIMFGYSYHLPLIKAAAPKLNFSVAKFPQIEGGIPPININFANYWVETVSKKSAHKNEAWNFIQFMTKAEQVESYLKVAKKPTAIRALIPSQLTDDDIGVFADQAFTARSWYRGQNVGAAENALKELIDAVLNNSPEKLQNLLNSAAAKVQQTIY